MEKKKKNKYIIKRIIVREDAHFGTASNARGTGQWLIMKYRTCRIFLFKSKGQSALTEGGLPLRVPMCQLYLWIQWPYSDADQQSFSALKLQRDFNPSEN